MKKIVFVIEQFCGGGAERVTAALANYFCRHSIYEVHLVVYSRSPENDYPADERIRWHVLPKITGGRLYGVMSRFKFLKHSIRSISPDCVLSLGTPRIAVLLTAALLGSGVPLILSERNDPSRYPITKIWRFLRTTSYHLADKIVFQTTGAMAYFPVSIQKKGAVIRNPITNHLPDWVGSAREKKIVNFCRLNRQKNLPLLMDAFSDISEKFPEYTVYIYGEGPERSSLENKIRQLGLEGKIWMPGHRDTIYNDIIDAALFVSSSDYEGISNSMLEAMALGIPTICTDCPAGGARDTIQDGVNGLLVPVGDRSALAEAMERVLSDESLRNTLSAEGRILRESLHVSKIAPAWMDIIEQTFLNC